MEKKNYQQSLDYADRMASWGSEGWRPHIRELAKAVRDLEKENNNLKDFIFKLQKNLIIVFLSISFIGLISLFF